MEEVLPGPWPKPTTPVVRRPADLEALARAAWGKAARQIGKRNLGARLTESGAGPYFRTRYTAIKVGRLEQGPAQLMAEELLFALREAGLDLVPAITDWLAS